MEVRGVVGVGVARHESAQRLELARSRGEHGVGEHVGEAQRVGAPGRGREPQQQGVRVASQHLARARGGGVVALVVDDQPRGRQRAQAPLEGLDAAHMHRGRRGAPVGAHDHARGHAHGGQLGQRLIDQFAPVDDDDDRLLAALEERGDQVREQHRLPAARRQHHADAAHASADEEAEAVERRGLVGPQRAHPRGSRPSTRASPEDVPWMLVYPHCREQVTRM